MPLWKIDVQKTYNGEYWTNRYLTNVPDILTADAVADDIIAAERIFHLSSTSFVKKRVATMVEADNTFLSTPLLLSGLRAIGSNQPLALFNTLRIDFPAGYGRPSRKYYRGVLTEADVIGAFITGPLMPIIENGLTALYAAAVCDPQETTLGRGVVIVPVQMRQMRRGTRRRTTPVI